MATGSKRGGKLAVAPRRRPAPKPKLHEVTLPVRITPDLLNRVDAIKPAFIGREPYIRQLLDIGIRTIEAEERAA